MNRTWAIGMIVALIAISILAGVLLLSAGSPSSGNRTSSAGTLSESSIQENESNPTGLKLGGVTICTHDCTYPATYISFTVFVNYTSQLRGLNLTINGVLVSQREFSTNHTLTPYAIIYKTSVSPSVMSFAPSTNYNVTMTAVFDDKKILSASTMARSNP
jgi:hypothetical protein